MTASIAHEQPTAPGPSGDRGHPKGLGMLFFAEMWERFSFYGMRGLLTLYLVSVVFADQANKDQIAAYVYGAYGALVYATPFLGGMLADRLIGYKRSVLLGAVLMAIGHGVMALENEIGSKSLLYLALAFLIAGNGFFKPNISSMVGGLYHENDPRRDRGFTIFYMGINLGALLQFIPAFLGQEISWSLGFGLAGIGMVVGLWVFYRGQGVLGKNGDPPDLARLKKRVLGPLTLEWLVYLGGIASVALYAFLVQRHDVMNLVLPSVAGLGFLIVLVYALRSEKIVRERLFVVLVLTLFNIIFWTFFEQAGSSISLFTDRNVDREIFGWHIPAAVFQSVNPAFILILAPLFTVVWKRLNQARKEPSIPVKFSLGLALLGVGFLVFVWGTSFVYTSIVPIDVDGREVLQQAATVPLLILLGGYFFHTAGELCLSPIGLSMVTKLSPKPIVAMVMGLWFLSTSLSHHVAGLIAAATGLGGEGAEATAAPGRIAIDYGLLTSASGHSETVLTSYDQLARYAEIFWPVGWVAIVAGVMLLVLSPLIRKWQHGVT